jgi:hypothetical protein
MPTLAHNQRTPPGGLDLLQIEMPFAFDISPRSSILGRQGFENVIRRSAAAA